MIFRKLLRNLFGFNLRVQFLPALIGLVFFLFLSSFIYSEERPSFSVHSHELDSGLKVYLKENSGSGLVAFALTVGAGSRTEGPWLETGISHLIEHLVFRGTDASSPSEVGKRVEQLGGDINAYTTPDFTLYYILMPKESASVALDILLESLTHPSFDSDSVEREKQVVLHEIQMGCDEPTRVLHKLFWKTAYRVHPYRVKTIGEESLLLGLQPADLIQYFQKMYVPSNMSLAIVGDFNADDMLKSVHQKFDILKRKSFDPAAIPQESEIVGTHRVEDFAHVELTHWIMGFRIPPFQNLDLIPLDVLTTILGDGTQSRLTLRLEHDLNLAQSVRCDTSSLTDPGMLTISALCEDGQRLELESEVIKILEQLKGKPVSRSELSRAKARILSDFYREIESLDKQVFWISMTSFLTGDPAYLQTYVRRIQDVSGDDILRVAQKYLLMNQNAVCALRPIEKTDSEKIKPSIQNRTKPQVKRLPNGISVIVSENHDSPMVSIQAVFKGGLLLENEKNNGLFQCMAKTAIHGTSKKNSSEILGPIEAAGGDLSGFSDLDSFGFSLKIPKDFFREGLNLLAEILQSASFPADELENEKKDILFNIREVKETPLLWALFQLRQNLFSRHPYHLLMYGTEASLAALTREEVSDAFQKYCRPQNLVISVFGDVSSEEAFDAVQKSLEGFSRPESAMSFAKDFSDANETLNVRQERIQSQSIVMVGFKGTTVKDEDRYGFELLAKLFSGFGSSLSEKVRTHLGAAYQLGAQNFLGLDPGFFVIYAGTSPEKAEEVQKVIQACIDELIRGEISHDDLLRAQNQVIAEEMEDLQTLNFRAREAAHLELYGIGVEELEHYREKVLSWDEKALSKMADKYFNKGRCVVLIVSPQKDSRKDH